MKKNLNIIQIKGIRGLILAGLVVCCLIAGFVVFPGLVCMKAWNYLASYALMMPTIGAFQGVLLWGILILSYFLLRKEKVVVCVKTPQGLSEDELKKVLADMKKQAQEDPLYQAMIRAREAELRYKMQEKQLSDESDSDQTIASEKTNV